MVTENVRWNDIEESTDTSTIGSENPDIDRGEEYIERMQTGMEETLSKPRKGMHVTDLVLCSRLRVFREIDPVPITAKALSIFTIGIATHGVAQWLFLRDSTRFEREKHLEFRDVMGSVDVLDKIRNVPIEFKNYQSLEHMATQALACTTTEILHGNAERFARLHLVSTVDAFWKHTLQSVQNNDERKGKKRATR
jgi:hypothetical protein